MTVFDAITTGLGYLAIVAGIVFVIVVLATLAVGFFEARAARKESDPESDRLPAGVADPVPFVSADELDVTFVDESDETKGAA
jgi:hypothetical protein